MKNFLKRVLALVLVLVMVCGYVPTTIFAAEAAPALPTATVSKIRKADLTFAMNFKADEATEAQLAYYGKWYADFELTVNKDVTFDANGTGDGYLAGQYDGEWEDAWAGQWFYVPFKEPVTLEANKPLKIMAFAAEMLNEPGLKYTYEEVYEVVKDFNCGVYFTEEFLEANPDLEVKLELRMYDPADETAAQTVGQSHIFTIADVNAAPALPTATATEFEKEELTFAMNFKADQVTDEQLKFYGNWYADFELTVNKDVTFDANGAADGWLSGQYDGEWESWHGEWMNVPFKPVTLNANEPLRIMAFAAESMGEPGLKYTYKEVYEVVKDFNCGAYFTPEFLVANPDLEVKLELRMYNPVDESESYVIGNTYTFNNEIVAYNVQTGAVYTTVSAATMDATAGQTVRLLKDTTDKKVYVLEGVTLDLNGYALATDYLFCTYDVVDDSEANTGLLKVAKSLLLQPDNRQLPVKTAEGYKFFEILGILDASTTNTTKDTVKYMFQPFFEAAAHEALLAGQATTGVTIRVRVTWTRADGTVADQDFTFPTDKVNTVLNSYRPATEDYGKMFTLELSGVSNYPGLTYQAYVVSDKGAEFTIGTQRVPTENQLTTEQVNLTDNAGSTAVVPEGTKVDATAKTLSLQVTDLESSDSNITVEEGEALKSVDVHVEGVAADNTAPILVTVAGLAEAGMNDGNLKLYHVENGVTNQMTQVATLAEVDVHNEFYYDPATGNVTMALATFSEITSVANEENPWNGECDENWVVSDDAQVYEIFNANQLAQFGKLVDEGNTFAGKTVRLMMNINLVGANFNPIGFGYAHSGGQAFCGVFDGNGNTINGLYQNCWELGEETYTYSTAGGGLFASVKDATIKNLTMDNAEIVMECIDMGVVVGYAQGNCTFENIVVRNSKLANYQRYTGGAIGEVSNGHHILRNVDVEATTTVSSLWGDFDASLGGIIGGKWESGTTATGINGHKVSVYMENCDVAARLDAYNDVTSAYQWYSYRRCGMLIGMSDELTTVNGRTEATASYLETVNCTVSYGDWATYHYCEFTKTTSLDARYPWVRVEANKHGFNDAYSNPRYGHPIVDGVAVDSDDHADAHTGTDGHNIEIVLNQLYGGGQGCYGGNTHVEENLGVTVIDAPEAVEKFTSQGTQTVQSNTTVTLGQLFAEVANLPGGQEIQDAYVYAYVSPVNEDVTARGTFNLIDASTPWEEKTLTFTGEGEVTITVTDYFYCTPTTITVNVQLIKTDAVVTTAPVANELTYNGSAQALVSGGGAEGGKLVFSLTEDGEFTQSVPTATNAGDYTVYYKVQGDATHNDSAVGSVQVTIAKAVASCTMTPTSTWTYNGTAQALVKVSGVKGASVVYSLAQDGTFTAIVPTTAEAGTYTVYYQVLGNENYIDSDVKSVTVTVHKADSTVTAAPVAKQELTYNTEAQPLVDAGTATGGEIWYKVEKQTTLSLRATRSVEVDEDGFSPVIPTATNAGTYIVYYKVKGDDNHNDSAISQVTVTVKKATPVVTAPQVNVSYGSTLENDLLTDTTEEGSLTWNDAGASAGDVGENSFTATYTPEDTENYEIVEVVIPVKVEKADPTYTLPTGLTATYGQTLANVGLPKGFTWKTPGDKVGAVGFNVFAATFTPEDTDRYNTVDVEITVEVKKADPKYTLPTGLTAKVGQTLADVEGLTEGFTWDDPTASLDSAGDFQFTATYTPNDTANYNTVQVNITVTVKPVKVQKFDLVFLNTDKQLYKIGNQNTVAVGKLFKAAADVTIGSNVQVTVEEIYGATGTYTANATWTSGTLKFIGTGVVKLTITDNEEDCIPTELLLEVVDAVNATTATSATSGNVVLLNDIGSGFTVSGRYTVYGNGFTLNYAGNGQYLNNGLKQGVVTVKENGTLDNLRIKATIYPAAYLYYGTNSLGEAVQDGPYSTEGTKTRYHYQLSAVAASGNATISNCYIYGGRTNIFVDTGDVTITDTVLECGVVANVQIQSNSSHTVTFNNVTTIQKQVNPTIDNPNTDEDERNNIMLGAGILVGPETNDNPKIVLNGEFKQYNWVNADDAAVVSNTMAKSIIQGALDAQAYNHTVDGKTASNLGIIYMNTYDVTVDNNTGLPYVLDNISMKPEGFGGNTVSGRVYSPKNATAQQIFWDVANADRSSVNGEYEPQFKFDDDLGGQIIPKVEGNDEFCYAEGDTVKVMFPGSAVSRELDLAALVNITKYTDENLMLEITCQDEDGNTVNLTDGKITLDKKMNYTVTYTVKDNVFFNKDGQEVEKTISYSWNVNLVVTVKNELPNAEFVFNSSKQIMGYGKKSGWAGIGKSNFQYLPFLAGLQIYDYTNPDDPDGSKYLRFDGNTDFSKIAKVDYTNESDYAYVSVTLVDGGKIDIKFSGRAASGSSTTTGTVQVSNDTVYWLTDGDTGATTTTWTINYYKFTGNSGVEISDTKQVFNNCTSGTVPSGSFGTSVSYTVTYDANGGDCGQTVGYATTVSPAVVLPTPLRDDYLFVGWFTAASGGTNVGGAGASYTPTANITLYAQWGKPSTVTYDANGGICDKTSEGYTGTALTLPTPTRDGYWFTGWFDAAEGGNKVGAAGASYQATGDITLYAQWSPVYTVTYNANGGSVSPASAQYTGTALTLPMPTKENCAFIGWFTATSGGVKIGDADASYIPSANITMYAQWKASVTVTYDANGGSCSETSATDTGAGIKLPTPTRTNYEFLGWSDGTNTYNAGTTIYPEANATLRAQWVRLYTATVSMTRASVTGINNGQTYREGTVLDITVSFTGDKNYKLTVTVGGTTVKSETSKGPHSFSITVTGDVVISATSENNTCVTPDTLVTLADGTQKRIDQVTQNEMLLVWDFVNGCYTTAPASILVNHGYGTYTVVTMQFSDGTAVKTINGHGFYHEASNKFVILDETNAADYIGHSFLKQNGDSFTAVTLTDVTCETTDTESWGILTAVYYNCFLENMLTMTDAEVRGTPGYLMPFEVGADMKYDEAKMQADIEKYGLYTYEDFADICTYEQFVGFGLDIFKVSVGKGYITWDEIKFMLSLYG